jgi:acetyltransferase-like isoleucine patch superfamily enzyme
MSQPARIDPLAHVAKGTSIGAGTTVWQFVVVLEGAVIAPTAT